MEIDTSYREMERQLKMPGVISYTCTKHRASYIGSCPYCYEELENKLKEKDIDDIKIVKCQNKIKDYV